MLKEKVTPRTTKKEIYVSTTDVMDIIGKICKSYRAMKKPDGIETCIWINQAIVNLAIMRLEEEKHGQEHYQSAYKAIPHLRGEAEEREEDAP